MHTLLNGLLSYCPITGKVSWLVARSNRVVVGKEIKQPKSCDNYVQIRVDGKLLLAHRVIWEELVGPVPSGCEINHKNGKKDDNRLDNLELVTHQENMKHAKATGLTPRCTRPERALVGVCKSTGSGLFVRNSRVAKQLGFFNVTEVAKGRRNSCGGYVWSYYEGVSP